MEERKLTKFDKVFAKVMGAIAGAHAGPAVGAAVEWFIKRDAKNPIGYDQANERFYRKDTGEYI